MMCDMEWNLFWSAVSAIATMSATITAIVFAVKDRIPKLDIDVVWEMETKGNAIIYISNPKNRGVGIKKIEFGCDGKAYSEINMLHSMPSKEEYYLLPQQLKIITLDRMDFDDEMLRLLESKKKSCELYVVLTTMNNKKYRHRMKVSRKSVMSTQGAYKIYHH